MLRNLSVAAVALLIVTGLSLSRAADVAGKAKVGAPAPQFSLTDQNEKTVSLADYAGKVVVLEWFNDECPIVQRHYDAGDMNKSAKAAMDNGVIWLAINSTHDKSDSSNQMAARKMHIDRPILNDATGSVGHLYGATNTPSMYVIDKNGVLAYAGAIDNNDDGDSKHVTNYVSQAVNELMAGKSVSTPQTKPYGCSVKYAN